jgi:hypothetical protein
MPKSHPDNNCRDGFFGFLDKLKDTNAESGSNQKTYIIHFYCLPHRGNMFVARYIDCIFTP